MSTRSSLRLLPFLLLLAASAAQARRYPGLPVDLSGWSEIRTPFFTLVANLDRARCVDLARRLDSFIRLIAAHSNARNIEPRVPARIYAFRTMDGYRAFAGSAGMYFDTPSGSVLSVSRSGNAADLVLFHEYAHFLLRNGATLDYPRWYDEGFADFVSTAVIRDGFASLGAPPASRVQRLREGKTLPLRTVLSARRYPESYDERLSFYEQSWLLVHYLHTSHLFGGPRRIESMQRYLEHVAKGEEWEPAFEAAFGTSVDAMEKRLRRHQARMRADRFPVLEVQIAPADGTLLRPTPLSEARAAERLADHALLSSIRSEAYSGRKKKDRQHRLLRESSRERADLAARLYGRSLRLERDSPTALAGLARAYIRRGSEKQAFETLSRVRRSAPDLLETSLAEGEVNLGSARRAHEKGDTAREARRRAAARKAYRRAIEQDPGLPAGHAGLGATFVDSGDDPSEGIEALLHVRAISHWSEAMALDLARLYRAKGLNTEARSELEGILRTVHADEFEGREAIELLAEIEEEMERRADDARSDTSAESN